ncbi:TPA: MucBP domain-containing protein, partial [Streptococcus suis]
MQKSTKKSFDWYGMKQRFSIRKYHFGAASVLLGMSLAVGTGTTVQAEDTVVASETLASSTTVVSSTESTPSSETSTATSTETSATVVESVDNTIETLAESTETVTSSPERKATINYIVQYVLEDGTVVHVVVQSVAISTSDAVGTATVGISLELPAGYELAPGQSASLTQEVTEGAENVVTVKVVKKAETTATTATSETVSTATTTTATATETIKTPATVEEAKVVLEQNISEAQVLSNEASRLYATTQAGNEALKTAADAIQLAVTEANAVLTDSLATLEQVNAQINAVRTNVEALAVEFRKFSPDGEVSVALFELAGTTAGLNNIGDGKGTLIKTDTTVSAPMTDAAGASVSSRVQSPYAPTAVDGYYTMNYMSVSYYDAIMGYQRYKPTGGTSTGGAYFRVSIKSPNVADPILLELVAKDGTLLESHYMTPNVATDFTYFQATSGVNKPMTATIRTDVASDTVLGQIFIQFDDNTIATATDTRSLPSTLISQPWEYTTYYKTTADTTNEALATYTIVGVPGNTVTPSGVREFGGYEYVNTTTENIQVNQVAGGPYVERTRAHVNGTYHKSVATPIGTDGSLKLDLYFADPNYAGTPNFEDTSTEGFIKILETQTMGYTQSNTTHTLSPELFDKYPIYFVDASTEAAVGTDKGPIPVKGTRLTSADQMDLLKLTSTSQYYQITFKENAAAGELSFARIGVTTPGSTRQIRIEYNVKGDGTETNDQADGTTQHITTYKGTFIPITLQNQPNVVTETTHWYRPVIQEAIIRYQVEGATDYLEESATLTGNPGTDITYSTEDTINKYKKLGYELVSDNFTADAGQDYDYDTTVKQEFLVVIKPRVVDVPKTAVPGEPVDPTDPNSPVWPATVQNLETTQEVTRTVEYKYEDGTPVRVDAAGNVLPKDSTEGTPLVKTETVTFTRPAQVNLVTGEVTYGDWVADTTDTLSGNQIPAITDYTATRTTLEGVDAPMSETVIPKTVAATDADINEVVYYTPNPKYGDVVVNYVNTDGKVIATPVVDTNDALVGTDYSTADRVPEKIIEDTTGDVYYYKEIKPEDAAKETGTVVEGTTEVTYVYEKAGDVVVNYTLADGTVIKDPVNDETNQKPGSPYDTKDNKPETITTTDGKVYKLVPTATKGNETGDVEAGKTTEVTYVYKEVKGNVIVNYVDENGNPISGVTDAGKETASTVEDTPETSTGTKYDTTDLRPNTITTADGKIYKLVPSAIPSNQTGTVTPGTTEVTYVYELVQGDVIVHYEDKEGNKIAADVTDTQISDTGTPYDTTDNKPEKIVNATTGEIYYILPKDEVKAGSASETGKVVEGTTEVTYVYEPAGSVTVNYVTTDGTVIKSPVKDEENAKPGKTYSTEDKKPTTITTEDGKTYKLVPSATTGDENGTVTSGEDKQVTYVYEEVKGSVVVNYIDTEGNVIKVPVTDTPSTSTGTAYDTTDNKPTTITTEDGTTYELVPVLTKGSETGTVVEGETVVTYVYRKVVTPTPDVKTGSVVIRYVEAGNESNVLKDPVLDENAVATGTKYDTTDEGDKPTEIVKDGVRYVLVPSKTTAVDPNGNVVTETGEVAEGTTVITYKYQKVANWIPQIPATPENPTPVNPVIPYPFDPTNPDKPVDPTTPGTNGEVPVIPYVPGYTPVDPKDNTPLTPVDPEDPNKGYVPPTPDESGKDTPIPYVQNGNVVVNYVTEDGTAIKTPVQDETDAPAGKSYDTTDNKLTEITTEDGTRYVLIPSKTVGSETGSVEGGKTTEITYVYKKVGNWVPQIPATPENPTPVNPVIPYPFDPTNPDKPIDPTTPGTNGEVPSIPYVPGYTPVDPKDNTPLKPIDPTDPSKGYVPPTPDETGVNTPIPYVQNGNVVVNYVTEDGTVIKTPVQDETNVPAGKSYDTTDNKPTEIVTEDGSRYVLIPSKTVGSETGSVVGGKTTEITYVYKKVGNWVPQIPATPENPTPVNPVVPYPFDPTNPDKPVDPTTPGTNGEVPVIPYVPGYTPVDPKDNTPLTPVDPEDPNKGYVPPTPSNTGEDTPIPYVQNGNVVVNYVDENGNVIKTPVQDETNAPAGKSYATTDNKPNTITTEDGTTYELVRVDGSETGTVVGGKTTEVTYVYRKVETPAKKVVTNHVDEN